jgi:hypothetical protein
MNIFVVYDCNKRKNILITPSARKAKDKFYIGAKIEVWNDGICIETIYLKTISKIYKYINMQKQYIGKKQAEAERRNKEAKRR